MATNFYVTITSSTPAFSISSGLEAEIFDAPGNHTINIAAGASVEVKGVSGTNTINIAANLSTMSAKLDGSIAVITDTSGNEIRIPFSGVAQSLAFADGTASLAINNGSPQLGNSILTGSSTSGSTILSTLGGTGGSTFTLTGGTQASHATFDAGTAAFKLLDDLTSTSFVDVSNFSSDDSMQYPQGTRLAISASGTDITVIVNDGAVNEVNLLGVNPSSAFITDIIGFNALPIGDIGFA